MRFRMRFLMVCAILSALFAAPLPSVRSDDSEHARKTLVGLQSVLVVVEDFGSYAARAKKDGLTKEKLQTSVELALRKVGIKVATEDEYVHDSEGNIGLLDLDLNLLPLDANTYVYCCDLQLVQDVHLQRDTTCCYATTWSVGCFGNVGSDRLASGMQEAVAARADKFCNAYLAANPKK